MTEEITSVAKPEEHDVVQITNPESWPGVLAIVEEVRPWGVNANMIGPGERGETASAYPIRLAWGEFEVIGRAVWAPEPE